MNLRKQAKDRECQIRIPGICNGNSETVVLCHIHKPSISGGIGLKANDVLAAWGCRACHDVADGRNRTKKRSDGFTEAISHDNREITIMFYEAIFRTQNILLKEGKL